MNYIFPLRSIEYDFLLLLLVILIPGRPLTHLLMYIGRIATIVYYKYNQRIGTNHAQRQYEYEHRLDGLRNADVYNEIVAGVTWMRAAWVLNSWRHE